MGDVLIHQALHGYRRGHERLASSIPFDSLTGDLIARLSDLSGSIMAPADFAPYLTLYPVLSLKLYAVAKTWLDETAPRGGCVYTHTLLIPEALWQNLPAPDVVESFFQFPSPDDLKSYGRPITESDLRLRSSPEPLREEQFSNFLSRYFGDGRRPIVWLGANDAENAMWHTVRGMWPKLRSRFACCTLALQPRALDNAPFDLLFAPNKYYSRFQKFPRENILEQDRPAALEKIEPWWHEWAAAFEKEKPNSVFGNRIAALLSELDADPTSARRLFLLRDLVHRVERTPTAAVGALDLIAAIAPAPAAASEFKRSSALTAVQVASAASSPKEVLKCLQLIDDRLSRPSFRESCDEVAESVHDLTASIASHDLLLALDILVQPQQNISGDPTCFTSGLLDGVFHAVERSPSCLLATRAVPRLPAYLLARQPTLASSLLHSADSQGYTREGAVAFIVECLRTVDDTQRRIICEGLFELSDVCKEPGLLDQLLHDLSAGEVPHTLDHLRSTVPDLDDSTVVAAIQRTLCRVHPHIVFQWAQTQRDWSPAIAFIAAECFSADRNGFEAVLEPALAQPLLQAMLVAASVRRTLTPYVPHWLEELLANDPRPVLQLIEPNGDLPLDVTMTLGTILDACPLIPIGNIEHSLQLVERIGSDVLRHRLVHTAVSDAVRARIREQSAPTGANKWLLSPHYSSWCQNIGLLDLQQLIAKSIGDSANYWSGCWKWLTEAPFALYARHPIVVPQIVSYVLTRGVSQWTSDIETLWATVVERALREGNRQAGLDVSIIGLEFCFRNTGKPLGKVVAVAFGPVYDEVLSSGDISDRISDLIPYWTWDKGKALRKELVDSFIGSRWSPGDLAMAARGGPLLRKIFKRVMRHWNGGEQYVLSMLNEVSMRTDPAAITVANELRELIASPNFWEDWD